MTSLARGALVALLGAAVSSIGLPAAAAAEGGLLRLAHLSPDTPQVDVYVDNVADPDAGLTLPGVGYGTVSDYQDVGPGTYTVSMRPAGADPEDPPVLSTTVEVGANDARTVAGVGPYADLGLEVMDDDLGLPPEGQARMRVIAAAALAETVDVALADGTPVATGLEFARTSEYVDVPAADASLRLTAAGGSPSELDVEVAAGSVYSVLVLDREGGGLEVRSVLDAASATVVPAGSVDAGAGGSAPTSRWPTWALTAIAAVLGLTALVSLAPSRDGGRSSVPGASRRRPRHGAGS